MSVIVKGMEMPSCCSECEMNYDSLGCSAILSDSIFDRPGFDMDTERLPNCPLRPLPEKHGRLGDLDELKTSFADSINECKKWIKELEENGDNETLVIANQAFCTFVEAALRLKSSPTIVEAEGD